MCGEPLATRLTGWDVILFVAWMVASTTVLIGIILVVETL